MASNDGVTITWLGHATTLVETSAGKRVLIDAWLQGNPATPADRKQLNSLDLMLLTHGHSDHIADAVEIAKATEPDVICSVEVGHYLQGKGVGKINGMNVGGTINWNGLDVTMTPAIHGSGIDDGGQMVYGGVAAGFVVRFENGFSIYHAGDTDVFAEMEYIGDRFHPDVALLPIGGYFTMDPTAAARAMRLLGVTTVIPIHYGTFPLLAGTPDQLRDAASDVAGLKVVALNPGESANQGDLV